MVNETQHYLFVKGKLGVHTTFDIEQKNLQYADFPPTHHGLQCNYVGGTPEHDKITLLCKQVVDIMKEIDSINNEALAGLTKDKFVEQISNRFKSENEK